MNQDHNKRRHLKCTHLRCLLLVDRDLCAVFIKKGRALHRDLLMAYDFGWDPFIKTFHWYQDNGYTQSSFERWERFTTFVDKLSEFSGKDIKKDYLSENNWKVFEDFYTGKTNQAV